MGLKSAMKLTTDKTILEVANLIWDLQNVCELQLRIEELKVLHGEYDFKMRKGVPVNYIFQISGAGPEGETVGIHLKPSVDGTGIKISSKSFLPTDIVAKPGNNKANVEEIVSYLKSKL
ncbi:hypothetical protein NE619_14160 [Anaerovorax odorimutans]|uniref:Uncharacterized protein n=1 Tax=Anaerovorax odorimutans TaxID=109327 RepID=A0ABT1RRP7_9FIRM|nr:hypothetical protein [Anaerovorax odorimutans]MCQ4637875.1 hypothetical protein [Anaerovorax odorimutans]